MTWLERIRRLFDFYPVFTCGKCGVSIYFDVNHEKREYPNHVAHSCNGCDVPAEANVRRVLPES